MWYVWGGGGTGLTSDFVSGKREGLVDGIRVIEFDLAYSNSDGFIKRSFTFLNFAWRSIGLALNEQYDVLFATTTPLTAGIPGIFARWLRRKPFVFEVRDLWPELPKAMGVIKNPIILRMMSVLEWVSYRSAHRCIGLSPGIVDGIAKRGVDRNRIALIPNGCDLDIFTNPSQPWRPKGVNDKDLMAIFTGTHGIANGLDALVDTALELKQLERDDIKIVLVGQGKLKATLEARANELQLKNIVFHPPVDKHKLSGLMFSADVGLQVLQNVPAFYYGTSPNKFFDYLSAGLPVINNYPGWLANIIQENNCGIAVEPNSSQLFAEALIYCAENPRVLVEMGVNSRSLAREKFDRDDLADQWVNWVTGLEK